MDEQDQKAGTPMEDDGDAAATQTAGTPPEDGRDAGDAGQGTDWRKLYLESKAKIERVNDLEQRAAELEAQLRSAPPPTADAETTQAQAKLQRLQAKQFELEQRALEGDADAELQLELVQDHIALKTQYLHDRELMTIADPAEREKTRIFFERNRRYFATPKAAHYARLGQEYEASSKTLAAREKQASEVIEGRKVGVATYAREVPAAEHKARMMSEADFEAQKERLRAEGRFEEMRELAGKALRGDIVLKR